MLDLEGAGELAVLQLHGVGRVAVSTVKFVQCEWKDAEMCHRHWSWQVLSVHSKMCWSVLAGSRKRKNHVLERREVPAAHFEKKQAIQWAANLHLWHAQYALQTGGEDG